jgi:hypothetical protein
MLFAISLPASAHASSIFPTPLQSPSTAMREYFLLAVTTSYGFVSGLLHVDPTITAPAVLPRQNHDRFIGYLTVGTTCKSRPDVHTGMLADSIPRGSTSMPSWSDLVSSIPVPSMLSDRSSQMQLSDSMCKQFVDVHKSRLI